MPIPSLPAELIDQILGYIQYQSDLAACARVSKSWLPFSRRLLYSSLSYSRSNDAELDFKGQEPGLLGTLQSSPALAALVTSLRFFGWYHEELEREEPWTDGSEDEFEARYDEEPSAPEPDREQLGQFLKCCLRLQCLSVRGAYLYLEDLVGLKDLVSLTFPADVHLCTRTKKLQQARLPHIKHLFAANLVSSMSPDEDYTFPNLSPQVLFTSFTTVTHLHLGDLQSAGDYIGDVTAPLRRLAPGLRSLTLEGEPPEWRTLLPLCTSLEQLSMDVDASLEGDSLLHYLPPQLRLLEVNCDSFGAREPQLVYAKMIELVVSSIKRAEVLQALVFRAERDCLPRDLKRLEKVCKEIGVSLRVSLMWSGRKEWGERDDLLVNPASGREELRWVEFSPRCDPWLSW